MRKNSNKAANNTKNIKNTQNAQNTKNCGGRCTKNSKTNKESD